MDVWRSVVERYSETNLTEEKDKLIAIAGIAKSLHHVTKDEYLAGMWREDLERNLLWSTKIGEIWRLGSDRPVMEPRKPADYRAPSWSWASVDGQIKIDHHIYPWRKYLTKIRIIHCATTPAKGWNMYGQILGGHLILKCHQLKKLKDIPFLMDHKRLSQATFHFDELADDVLQTTKPFESDFDIYLLLCMVSVEEQHLQQNLHGMLLKSISETGEHGLYERMGAFKLEGTTDGFLSFPWTEDSEAYLEDPPADPRDKSIVSSLFEHE